MGFRYYLGMKQVSNWLRLGDNSLVWKLKLSHISQLKLVFDFVTRSLAIMTVCISSGLCMQET
jgi:hypothetical protein